MNVKSIPNGRGYQTIKLRELNRLNPKTILVMTGWPLITAWPDTSQHAYHHLYTSDKINNLDSNGSILQVDVSLSFGDHMGEYEMGMATNTTSKQLVEMLQKIEPSTKMSRYQWLP